MYSGISFVSVCLVLMLCCKGRDAIKCYTCSNHQPEYTTSCRDGTFRADEVPTFECNTSCVVVSGSQLPGFPEWFDLFDKDNSGVLSTEEAAKALNVIRALQDSSNGLSEDELRSMLGGYDHGKLKVAFEKIDVDGDGKISSTEEARLLTQYVNSTTTAEQLQSLMNGFDPYVWSRKCFQKKLETVCIPPEPGSDYTSCFCNTDGCNGGTNANGNGSGASTNTPFIVLAIMTTVVFFL